MCGGRLLTDRPTEELLSSTKRIRAVLRHGSAPQRQPSGIVCQAVENREWLLTVSDFSGLTVKALQDAPEIRGFDVTDLSLDDIFQDYVRGARAV